MRTRASSPRNEVWVGSMVFVVSAAMAFPPGALAAERMVLGEYFTWNQCSVCTVSGPLVNSMIDAYGAHGSHPDRHGTFAVVEYHLWDAYQVPWGATRGQTFYGAIFDGTPFFGYDGLSDAWPIGSYESNLVARQAVATTVTMSVGAEVIGENAYRITVRTCLEPTATPVDLRIYAVVVEDSYPSVPTYSRNTFRAAMPTKDVTLEPGACEVMAREVTVTPLGLGSPRYLKFIVWAQDPNASWPAEVHQAAIGTYPWTALPATGDYDNDGDVDLADYESLADCLTGPSPADAPDAACRSAFDSDGDGDVDLDNLHEFMISFTGNR